MSAGGVASHRRERACALSLMSTAILLSTMSGVLVPTPPAWASGPVYDKIAFSRQQSGQDWDIWIMNVDGTSQAKLVDNTYGDRDPHFRYDGTKIVFGRFIPGTPPTADIYAINADGTGETNLTGALAKDTAQPKFSWGGAKIVFAVSEGAGPGSFNDDIYTMNADGSGTAGAVTGGADDVWPSFSPDGKYIVFQGYVTSRTDRDPKSKICRYSVATGATTDLTDGSDLDEMPVYSPDGRYVIFKRGFTNTEIYRVDLTNMQLTNLTGTLESGEDAPMYSYEGNEIAYFSITAGINSAEIWIMSVDGTDRSQLTSNSVADFNPTFSPAHPQVWQPTRRLTNNVGTSWYPSLAVSGTNLYLAWRDSTFGGNDEILFRRSTDGGATWGAAQRLTSNAGVSCSPSVAATSTNVYVAWQDDTYGGNQEILFRRSTNNGTTWDPIRRLTNNAGFSQRPSVATSESNVYVVWSDNTPGGYEVFFRASGDGGASWGAIQRLTNNAGSSASPSITTSGSTVYVAWQDDTFDGNDEILFRRSTNSGATWKPTQRLTSNAGASMDPSLAASGSSVYVAWSDDTFGGNWEILFKRSTDNGTTWSSLKRLTSNTGSSQFASVAASDSNVYVCWADTTYGGWEILFRRSMDRAGTWQRTQRLTNNPGVSEYPSLAATGSSAYVAWDDDTYSENKEILFKRSTV